MFQIGIPNYLFAPALVHQIDDDLDKKERKVSVTFRQMDVTQHDLQDTPGDFRVSHQLLINDEILR